MSSNIFSNPNIVDGPRKCLPSKCVTENGDQLSNKKAKTSKSLNSASAAWASKASANSISHHASVENIPEPVAHPRQQPQHGHILDLADDTDDELLMPALEDTEPVDWDNDDDDDESKSDLDDITELSAIYIFLLGVVSILKQKS